MRILFISDGLLTGDLAYRLVQEGHDVKLYIHDPTCSESYQNLVPRTSSWEQELSWVGKDGLIIFDDFGYAPAQERLRAEGYAVCGGSAAAEKTETDRMYGHHIFQSHGIETVPLQSFDTAQEAISFVERNLGQWVIKYQNSHWHKTFTYIGERADGSDVIAVLSNYERLHKLAQATVTLQKRVYGIEIGVARYFNGVDWVGPIEYNVEHTHLFPGEKGPVVNEMGTLMWLSSDESEKLYASTLHKLTPFLRESGFRGDYDINCIVNEQGAFPLEATARFGAPAIHGQFALQTSQWGEFLHGVAQGKQIPVTWQDGYCVVVSVVTPPFPYRDNEFGASLLGLPVKVSTQDESILKRIHFDEIASRDGTLSSLYISGTNGYALYVTGTGATVDEARTQAYQTLEHVYVPRMFYRDDIGQSFAQGSQTYLQQLGYLI